jgi:hypothetical protein
LKILVTPEAREGVAKSRQGAAKNGKKKVFENFSDC